MPSFPPVQSVQRALALLAELNRQRVTSVGELHQRTGLPKPTIVRLLETLIAEGFAASDSRVGGYQVTSKVAALSSGFHGAPMVIEAARPWAIELTRKLKWPAAVAVLPPSATGPAAKLSAQMGMVSLTVTWSSFGPLKATPS